MNYPAVELTNLHLIKTRVTSNYLSRLCFTIFLRRMRFSASRVLCFLVLCLSVLLTIVSAETKKEDGIEPTVVILFMFFGLGLGIIVMQVLSVFGEAVPYTVIVFVLGVIFSLCADKNGKVPSSWRFIVIVLQVLSVNRLQSGYPLILNLCCSSFCRLWSLVKQ